MQMVSPRSEIFGTVAAPSSKSYAQRAIAASLLSEGITTLEQLELCDDTASALAVALTLGARFERPEPGIYKIAGGWSFGRLHPLHSMLNVGESGLSARMFAPIAALCDMPVTIEGEGSLISRPFGPIAQPLQMLGAKVYSHEGGLPLVVKGPLHGGTTEIDGSVSSQFITGLLMALPLVPEDSVLSVSSPVSLPYIDMTLDLLDKFGVQIQHEDYSKFYIKGSQKYECAQYFIEGDWSGSAFLLAAGAIAGEVTVMNLNMDSLQADTAIIPALRAAGASVAMRNNSVTVAKNPLKAFEFDATNCPDLFPVLVALAANCKGTSVIRGAGRLASKESNRAQALRTEFGKMGIEIDMPDDNTITVKGGTIRSCEVEGWSDHRIIMAEALAGLRSDKKIIINGAEHVAKSYPGFWHCLDLLTHGKLRK